MEGILTFWINCTSVVYFAIYSDKRLVVFGQRLEYLDLIDSGGLLVLYELLEKHTYFHSKRPSDIDQKYGFELVGKWWACETQW